MASWTDAVGVTVSIITAMGALGTAAFGVIDATKAFGGGISNIGFSSVLEALGPYKPALDRATLDWRATLRANWINGVAKEDQKTAAKTLIRLGISSTNVQALAGAGGVDPVVLSRVLAAIESGQPLSVPDAQVFGRLNAVIDAAMDAGFERGDQQYRNASKLAAGVLSVFLAWWAAFLLRDAPPSTLPVEIGAHLFWWATLVGVLAVPVAPVAKDLASSLQSAAAAVAGGKS
jgi:hypothetical protein